MHELNLLGLWSQCDSSWSSTVKEEIQAATNEPIIQEEPNSTNKVVLFGVLTVLALLFIATLMQAPKIHQAMKEAGETSIEQLLYLLTLDWQKRLFSIRLPLMPRACLAFTLNSAYLQASNPSL
ncbi:MAG: hypothetical protein KME25_34155 [Symplocastrum torsivum CPER-KK1]|uniref:Uncharacterized protein n=1 Tax=Symplocastrum torsivum CPER-KK1 TaxID=450513 RepID=A0A951PTC4_9CYAN|nr:hypothetical protein [Symplocastrum torsivum CPER-KK1]